MLWAEKRRWDGDRPSSHEAGSHGVFPDRSQVVVFAQKAEEKSAGETLMPHTETGRRRAERRAVYRGNRVFADPCSPAWLQTVASRGWVRVGSGVVSVSSFTHSFCKYS